MRRLAALLVLFACAAQAGNLNYWGPGGATHAILAPDADVTTTGWTSTGAALYTEVDDTPDAVGQISSDDSTTRITAPKAVACRATFDVAAPPSMTGKTINFVALAGRCLKDNGSGVQQPAITAGLTISATDYAGVTLTCSATTYSDRYMTKWYTNPNTSAAWTESDLTSLRIYLDKPSTTSPWDGNVTSFYAVVSYEDAIPTDGYRQRSGGGN